MPFCGISFQARCTGLHSSTVQQTGIYKRNSVAVFFARMSLTRHHTHTCADLDASGDGKLSHHELEKALVELDINITTSQAHALVTFMGKLPCGATKGCGPITLKRCVGVCTPFIWWVLVSRIQGVGVLGCRSPLTRGRVQDAERILKFADGHMMCSSRG